MVHGFINFINHNYKQKRIKCFVEGFKWQNIGVQSVTTYTTRKLRVLNSMNCLKIGDVPFATLQKVHLYFYVKVKHVARDITERKIMEDELQKALEDKDVLIKEVHHRVKNNLMIQIKWV